MLETIDRIAAVRRQRMPTPALNKFLESVTAANPPVSPGRKHVRIMYAAQIGVMPPSFVFFTNVATTFHFSYERFLINKLREQFGFVGTPIRIQVRRRAKGGGPRKESKGRADRTRREVRAKGRREAQGSTGTEGSTEADEIGKRIRGAGSHGRDTQEPPRAPFGDCRSDRGGPEEAGAKHQIDGVSTEVVTASAHPVSPATATRRQTSRRHARVSSASR